MDDHDSIHGWLKHVPDRLVSTEAGHKNSDRRLVKFVGHMTYQGTEHPADVFLEGLIVKLTNQFKCV